MMQRAPGQPLRDERAASKGNASYRVPIEEHGDAPPRPLGGPDGAEPHRRWRCSCGEGTLRVVRGLFECPSCHQTAKRIWPGCTTATDRRTQATTVSPAQRVPPSAPKMLAIPSGVREIPWRCAHDGCTKKSTTRDGIRAHAKAKHGVQTVDEVKEDARLRRDTLAELARKRLAALPAREKVSTALKPLARFAPARDDLDPVEVSHSFTIRPLSSLFPISNVSPRSADAIAGWTPRLPKRRRSSPRAGKPSRTIGCPHCVRRFASAEAVASHSRAKHPGL